MNKNDNSHSHFIICPWQKYVPKSELPKQSQEENIKMQFLKKYMKIIVTVFCLGCRIVGILQYFHKYALNIPALWA